MTPHHMISAVANCRACGASGMNELWRSYATLGRLFFCTGCRSIQREGPAEARTEISGAMVLRVHEHLATCSGDDLVAEVERLGADASLFVLLRVPEIFETARRAFGARAILTRPAEHPVDYSGARERLEEFAEQLRRQTLPLERFEPLRPPVEVPVGVM